MHRKHREGERKNLPEQKLAIGRGREEKKENRDSSVAILWI
jgi:hypothetical protein